MLKSNSKKYRLKNPSKCKLKSAFFGPMGAGKTTISEKLEKLLYINSINVKFQDEYLDQNPFFAKVYDHKIEQIMEKYYKTGNQFYFTENRFNIEKKNDQEYINNNQVLITE